MCVHSAVLGTYIYEFKCTCISASPMEYVVHMYEFSCVYMHIIFYSPVCIQWNLSTLRTEQHVVRVKCPVAMYTNGVFRTAKCVLFTEVSSFQGVLIKRVPLL